MRKSKNYPYLQIYSIFILFKKIKLKTKNEYDFQIYHFIICWYSLVHELYHFCRGIQSLSRLTLLIDLIGNEACQNCIHRHWIHWHEDFSNHERSQSNNDQHEDWFHHVVSYGFLKSDQDPEENSSASSDQKFSDECHNGSNSWDNAVPGWVW